MEDLKNVYFFITIISLIVAIISIRYTLTIRNYLKEFIYVSKKVSNKEFHARLNIRTKGELGDLASNFNYMIETMDDTLKEAEYNHLQLKSILKSISHGILATDVNGNILLINEECKKTIKSDPDSSIEGQNINIAIKDDCIRKEVSRFIGSKKSSMVEIKTEDDIFYKIKLDPVYLQNTDNVIIGSIVNIENITEKVKLENMRSDFVANVSHELKTPLTSITGFVETLILNENIDVENRNKFLGIIESESDRLKRLIDDILLLSFIENDENMVSEKVKVYEVFKEVYNIIENIAKSKNIEIVCECDDKNISAISNRDYISQILLNLVDNAIKYTPKDGHVKVIIDTKEDFLIIRVMDDGVGIAEKDIDRIFERFYRVDKARSREVGGTGLGLAITKHIVKILEGTIEVKSQIGKGTEFIVSIPKNFLN